MKQEARLQFLDSLRGLASLTVVLSHFFLAYGIDAYSKIINFSPLHFFYDGFAAVTFFFVLSGFVLGLSLNKYPDFDLLNFYLKRLFRIMPSYWVVLFLSLFFYLDYSVIPTKPESTSWINEFWQASINIYNFLKQALFIQIKSSANLLFQNWTLNIEMLFSFLIPFLFLILKSNKVVYFFVFNVLLFTFFNIPVFIFHFSIGIILAIHKEKITLMFINLRQKSNIFLILITIFLYTYRYTLPMYYYYYYRKFNFLNNESLVWILTGLGSFLILLYCMTNEKIIDRLNNKFLLFIGKISYSIYLVHSLVLIYFVPKFIFVLNSQGINNDLIVLLSALCFLVLFTIIISSILNKYIELPFVKFGNIIISKLSLKL